MKEFGEFSEEGLVQNQQKQLPQKQKWLAFLICLLIVFPIWLCVLLPLTIIWMLLAKIFGCLFSKCKKRRTPAKTDNSELS
jgi:4-hydroxybenzoate polyprenyltransferase